MSAVTVTKRRKSQVATVLESKTAKTMFGEEFHTPEYTIKDILDAIPKHCYERSLIRSFGYLFRDLFFIGLNGYVAVSYIHLIPSAPARFVAWTLYTFIQGLLGVGCWILAHECGHGAFSDYRFVNDTVGWFVHSALLVPYHSWRLSHSKHHKATGNMQRDMAFVPFKKEEFTRFRGITVLAEAAEDTPIMSIYFLLAHQLFGWVAYLATNASGQLYPGRSVFAVNHYNPKSPIFDKKDFWDIVISDLGLGLVLAALYFSAEKWGYWTVFVMHIVPWFWVHHWLIQITFLHHTDHRMPHYDNEDWNFCRGASATIDREFGFIGKHVFHDIIETHVLHHFVSRIPFYNAREATEAIKKVMGSSYVKDDSNFVTSLYTVFRSCQYVEGDNGVYMYRNKNNIGVNGK
jgi:fatty acid desaturase